MFLVFKEQDEVKKQRITNERKKTGIEKQKREREKDITKEVIYRYIYIYILYYIPSTLYFMLQASYIYNIYR